jgi:histidine triad (HIT) family protein
MPKTNCIFCQIVADSMPSYTIYEDQDFLAFLDISQIVDGHTLVIPKVHYRWVWDVPNIGAYFEAVQKVARKMQAISGSNYVKSVTLGVLVEHAHVHLLPKTEGNVELIENAWSEAREARKLTENELIVIKDKFTL